MSGNRLIRLEALGIGVAATAVAFLSFMSGRMDGISRCKAIQVEAVEHGYAEWVPDTEGKTTFTWKENQ